MKYALKPSGCGVDITSSSGRLWRLHTHLYGAFLEREAKREMDSFFRLAEAMGLNPMGKNLPGLLQRRLDSVHAMVDTLRSLQPNLKPQP